jgi:hypothetical protein
VQATLTDWLCPGGSQAFDLSAIADLPDGWVGTARVDSLVTTIRRDSSISPRVEGAVFLHRPGSGTAAYDLIPHKAVFPAELDVRPFPEFGTELVWRGTSALGVPAQGPAAGPGGRRILALHNATPGRGHADVGLYLFDPNGLVDVQCLRLDAGHTLRVDLAVAQPAASQRVGTLVAADSWDHTPPGDAEPAVAGLIGLTAVYLEWTEAVASARRDTAEAPAPLRLDGADDRSQALPDDPLGWLPGLCRR